MAVAQDKRASELTAPVSIADTDMIAGYRPGTGGEPNLDIRMSVGLIRGTTAIAVATAFSPVQTIWLLELTCSAAGPATVTLSGVRRDTGATETVNTYELTAGTVTVDTNASCDHGSFSWSKTGAGVVTVRVL